VDHENKKDENGFHLTLVLLAVLVIGFIGFASYKVFSSRNHSKNNSYVKHSPANLGSAHMIQSTTATK
jgi:hypothetical protein